MICSTQQKSYKWLYWVYLMSIVLNLLGVYCSCFGAIDTTINVFRSLFMKEMPIHSVIKISWCCDTLNTSRLVLGTYCLRYPQAMPFLVLLQKLQICTLFKGVSSSNCPKFTKIRYALFHQYRMHALSFSNMPCNYKRTTCTHASILWFRYFFDVVYFTVFLKKYF